MKKKTTLLSIVTVASVAACSFAVLTAKRRTFFNAKANPTYKQIVLLKGNMTYLQEGDDGLFDFYGKCAFDTERDFSIKDGESWGPITLGGDHIFTVASYDYWYFQFNVKLRGTHNQFEYISFYGTFDGVERAVQRNSEYFEYMTYDPDEDLYNIPVYEDSGYSGCTMDYSSITIDKIIISYGC